MLRVLFGASRFSQEEEPLPQIRDRVEVKGRHETLCYDSGSRPSKVLLQAANLRFTVANEVCKLTLAELDASTEVAQQCAKTGKCRGRHRMVKRHHKVGR